MLANIYISQRYPSIAVWFVIVLGSQRHYLYSVHVSEMAITRLDPRKVKRSFPGAPCDPSMSDTGIAGRYPTRQQKRCRKPGWGRGSRWPSLVVRVLASASRWRVNRGRAFLVSSVRGRQSNVRLRTSWQHKARIVLRPFRNHHRSSISNCLMRPPEGYIIDGWRSSLSRLPSTAQRRGVARTGDSIKGPGVADANDVVQSMSYATLSLPRSLYRGPLRTSFAS
ncbi:hypothetical protein BDV10DRAFT_65643 [Aspergillus recurvatus]